MTPSRKRTRLWRLISAPATALILIILLLEEWLWEPLQALAARIGRLPILRNIEVWISRLPPQGALCAFLIPTLVLLPFKFLALAAFARGMFATGFGIAIVAKGVGTALVARIFTLCKPTLLSIPWFARAHAWLGALRSSALEWIRASWGWRLASDLRRSLRRAILTLKRCLGFGPSA